MKIIQSMSPQAKKTEEAYVPGAEEGDLFHTVLNKAYKKLYFVPCRFQHVHIQWKNREAGGGMVTAYENGDPSMPETFNVDNRDVVKDDPESYLENTLQYICMMFDEDHNNLGPAILSFKSSQLKYARRFNATLAQTKLKRGDGSEFRAPIFAHKWELSTTPERNDRGSWFSYSIGEKEFIKDPTQLKELMDFAKSLAEERKVFVDTEESEATVTEDNSFEI